MFESLSLLTLQQYWWFVITLLGGLFVFMMFVQGGQTLLNTLSKTETEKNVIIASLGRKWELTFTTLVMFGGALFAAFPLLYAVSFGGAYYVWMAILFCFILQAVSYEYRKKPDNFLGQKTYETFLYLNGSLGIILIGIALATFYTGANFIKNDMNLSSWTNHSYGLEAVLNPFNVLFGFVIFFLARSQASLYFINAINEEKIVGRARKQLTIDASLFVVLFLVVAGMLLLMSGVAYHQESFSIVEYKFLTNLIETPTILALLLAGVVLVLYAFYITLFRRSTKGIWFSGTGTVLTVVALLSLLGYNQTAIYPSLADINCSLNIENSSGSHYTLTAMSYVSLFVPVVLGYIYLVWKSMDKEKLTSQEVEADHHHY
ncbi:MAG TPA: cytochrome d ubiquinol oxidase subunit II [Sulfurovum sp.]|jgi:cytochrome d ubiquinol oxidase subunit II|nr:MAG: cytochrome C oxidase assembly protein [Sulfurovum sp. 35-42-20]OYZ24021.1 MAG: cytochrome C oxidase assembly protein [Sulfurovum sp. 16-42-52]OYZ48300.1 MAG: cytochrome C oxidase assembly protein [Sulfurovum sp. 24-42-9]OZA43930.1 MAG: cytochrome C oxidase assembly protein [Sulfurovum sp. 17-42-90]OZA60740.1 MAG: cytochrome C oxidase assembly protein [Sulfurovum sp. 39-42-12]HQR74591.1 cytochrome d ubiquinol oxidase subunit II [Sulfurovum sp.]